RRWDNSRHSLVVIGLNPSTADESDNDPTIQRCMVRAHRGHFGGLIMLNLFAFRATDPAAMLREPDPIGPGNDVALSTLCRGQDTVLAAWGTPGHHLGRQARVLALLRRIDGLRLYALGFNANQTPKHPLYLGYSVQPTE